MAAFFDGRQGGGLAWAHVVGIEMAGEHRALTDLAFNLQPRVVQAEDVLDDGQAQAGAAAFAGAAAGDAVETFGQARQMRGRDAVAGITHGQHRAIAFAAELDGDAATGRVPWSSPAGPRQPDRRC
ncbi:hypothetical protein G6F59_015440 [Rhizopus arrhizus]|nr:hypothetical protein G6F59_015440 [Rhizopus arrhizus]